MDRVLTDNIDFSLVVPKYTTKMSRAQKYELRHAKTQGQTLVLIPISYVGDSDFKVNAK
jgi:hypothetical protein